MTIDRFISYSTSDKKIKLSKKQKDRVQKSAERIEKIVEDEIPVYGINTGFGALCSQAIKKEDIRKLQANLIKSHSCGIGNTFTKEETKGAMLLLINSLSKGHSGIRLNTLETLVDMYNKKVMPVVPEMGSLGASGDLIPLAHMALVLIGNGTANYQGASMPGNEAMKKAGINPITLGAKEGLALINGTHVIAALSGFNLYNSLQVSKNADIAGALTFEALSGLPKCMDERIHNLKPHKGQKDAAANIRKLIEGSIITGYSKACNMPNGKAKVQDAYSLRCIPQIHGAVKDELYHIRKTIETEMNSVTDNPLVFEDECLSGGNFHGQHMAFAMDNLASVATTLASVSERRCERMMNMDDRRIFLADEPGLNSGFMIAQYLSASLLSMNKVLSYPASNTSLPVSSNQEDYVSMAMTSSLKAREIVKNAAYVIGIEMMCGAQALRDYNGKRTGKGTRKAYETIREYIPQLKEDRILAGDIEQMYKLVHESIILNKVENKIGRLK